MTTRTALLVLSLVAAPALAQVQIQVQVPLPTITFSAPPPLVVVQPGVQVVEDLDEEVYFADGYYWVRRGGSWYRTASYRGGWTVVEPRVVPAPVVRLPPGQYRKWKKHHGDGHGHDKHPGKHQGKHQGKGRGHHRD